MQPEWPLDSIYNYEETYFGNSLAMKLALRGNLVGLKLMYKGDFKGKYTNGTTLMLGAAMNGHLHVMQWLYENGSSLTDRTDSYESCLTYACKYGHLETIKWLVEKGCSVNDMNKYGTCVMIAACYKKIEVVEWLLSNGASVKENTYYTEHGSIEEKDFSCEDILKRNGNFEYFKRIFETKSARK